MGNIMSSHDRSNKVLQKRDITPPQNACCNIPFIFVFFLPSLSTAYYPKSFLFVLVKASKLRCRQNTTRQRLFTTNFVNQTLANQGPDSRFVLEVIFRVVISKLSWSSIMSTLNCVHLILYFQPESSTLIFTFWV